MAAWGLALALALGASAHDEAPRLQPWTRQETPALAGLDASTGDRLDLAALRGRAVLVVFWASWCEACADELPALARLAARHAGRPFTLVTVNVGESPERARSFLREHGLALPVLSDRDQALAKAWGAGGVPMSYLVDAAGRVRSSAFGEQDWKGGTAGAALERLVREAESAGTGRAAPAAAH